MGLDYADAVRCDTPEMMVRWFIEADLYDVCRNLFMACFSFDLHAGRSGVMPAHARLPVGFKIEGHFRFPFPDFC